MSSQNESKTPDTPKASNNGAQPASVPKPESKTEQTPDKAREFGGPKGLEPTRYGDWEKQGRCIDF